MKDLINSILAMPLKRNRPPMVIDGRTSLEELVAEDQNVATVIVLQQTKQAMRGDRGAAEFLMKYGGHVPNGNESAEVDVPRIVNDLDGTNLPYSPPLRQITPAEEPVDVTPEQSAEDDDASPPPHVPQGLDDTVCVGDEYDLDSAMGLKTGRRTVRQRYE